MDVTDGYLRAIDERAGRSDSVCIARLDHVGLVREEPRILTNAPCARPMPRQYARSALKAAKQAAMRGPAGSISRQDIGVCSATSDASNASGSHAALGKASSGNVTSESNAMGGWR
jgi:hypothetical protein